MASGADIAQILLILYASAILADAQWITPDTSAEDRCRTPKGETGSCVAIRECGFIIKFLENAPKPLSQKDANTLRSYQCAFDSSGIKVCCPSSSTPTPNTNQDEPPDVSRHRNLRLLPTNCGFVNTNDKIIFGNKTGVFEFSWMALISYRTPSGPDFRCAGTVINNRYILTAAHCLANQKYPIIGVRVGEHDIRTSIDCEDQDGEKVCASPYQDLAVEQIIPHPKFNKFSDDIGLIRVTPAINTAVDNVRPICLPVGRARTYNFTNRNVVITGWGATENSRSSDELLKIEIPIYPLNECIKKYKEVVKITQKQLCAGGGQSDSCRGDSGGPMQVISVLHDDTRYIQMGVVSFGPSICGLGGNPGVYTRVAYYMDWILDNLRN